MKEYIVSQEEKGKRLDTYIPSVDTDITRTSAQRLIEDGNILVNGKNAKVSYKIQENDKISVEIPEPKQIELKAQNIPIEIIYEDSDIIVVNKRPNMVVHPTKRYQSGTLANALLYYFKETNQDCIVRLVSRLDMDTSGLIIIAKNQKMNNGHSYANSQNRDSSSALTWENRSL